MATMEITVKTNNMEYSKVQLNQKADGTVNPKYPKMNIRSDGLLVVKNGLNPYKGLVIKNFPI
jgi:hypothetical protein